MASAEVQVRNGKISVRSINLLRINAWGAPARRHLPFAGTRGWGSASAATAARCVSGIGFEVVRTVRSAVDAYHRQDNDGCRFRRGVDVPASARIARFVGKPNDIAHCNPLAASKSLLWTYRVGALS